MTPTEEHANAIMGAAHVLIGTVRMAEHVNGPPSGELTVQVQVEGGGVETWIIVIECVSIQ